MWCSVLEWLGVFEEQGDCQARREMSGGGPRDLVQGMGMAMAMTYIWRMTPLSLDMETVIWI